jgi:hypothetical protein
LETKRRCLMTKRLGATILEHWKHQELYLIESERHYVAVVSGHTLLTLHYGQVIWKHQVMIFNWSSGCFSPLHYLAVLSGHALCTWPHRQVIFKLLPSKAVHCMPYYIYSHLVICLLCKFPHSDGVCMFGWAAESFWKLWTIEHFVPKGNRTNTVLPVAILIGITLLQIFLYQKNLLVLTPRSNYIGKATAAFRRSYCQILLIEGATWSV